MKDDGPVVTLRVDSERADDWLWVFRRLSGVPVVSFYAQRVDLPEKPNVRVYMLDLRRVTAAERERLIVWITKRFEIAPDEVDRSFEAEGCPVLAEDVERVSIPMGGKFGVGSD